MISPKKFYEVLKANKVSFFTGVPDSLLKEFCAYIEAISKDSSHVIAANEGSAIAIATGHHLASGDISLVYLQNSGLGNTVNPLLSLADKEVYSIPMILLIGWRGEPGIKDEPQHIKQGRVTPSLLESMEIPFKLITKDLEESIANIKWATQQAIRLNSPIALLVKKGSFDNSEEKFLNDNKKILGELSREEAISIIIQNISKDSIVVSSTGMISRELYEQRNKMNQTRANDFLTVGSMGHASQIALGISKANPSKKVVCIDGDGAALMHLGGMALIGTNKTGNLLHIILNNAAHDSVGGQPTVANEISLTTIAKGCRYKNVEGPVQDKLEIINAIKKLDQIEGMRFVEIYVDKGSRADLARPKESPKYNKEIFIAKLRT